jgi:hypothetical protein
MFSGLMSLCVKPRALSSLTVPSSYCASETRLVGVIGLLRDRTHWYKSSGSNSNIRESPAPYSVYIRMTFGIASFASPLIC